MLLLRWLLTIALAIPLIEPAMAKSTVSRVTRDNLEDHKGFAFHIESKDLGNGKIRFRIVIREKHLRFAKLQPPQCWLGSSPGAENSIFDRERRLKPTQKGKERIYTLELGKRSLRKAVEPCVVFMNPAESSTGEPLNAIDLYLIPLAEFLPEAKPATK